MKHRDMLKKSTIACLILLVILGTAVRTYGLGRLTLQYRESLTLLHISGHLLSSSLISVTRASELGALNWEDLIDKYQTSGEYFRQVARVINVDQPDRPPGFYQALYVWAQNYGDEPYVLRLLPVLFGVIGLPAFFWFAFELFQNRASACLATTMQCLSPLHIFFSRELAEYSLFIFFFSVSCASLLRALRQGGLSNWCVYSGSIVAGVYCSYLMILVLCAQVLWSLLCLISLFRKNERLPRLFINQRIVHAAIAVASLVILSPVLSMAATNLKRVQTSYSWITQTIRQSDLNNAWLASPLFSWTYRPSMTFEYWSTGLFDSLFWYHVVIHVILFSSICYMTANARRELGFLATILFVFLFAIWIPDALWGGRRSIAIQFFLPVPTIAILPVSYMLSQIWSRGNTGRRVMPALCIIFLLTCQVVEDRYVLRNPMRDPPARSINAVAEMINRHPDYPVIVDLERRPSQFAYALALGRLVDVSRQIVIVRQPPPAWIKHYFNAYILNFDDELAGKYKRFKIKWISRPCGVALIYRSGAKPDSASVLKTSKEDPKKDPVEIERDSIEIERQRSFWNSWFQLDEN
ncbi:MAG: glycosyltransferase family 39 protein [Candidatus Obscuribacterales bacterium]|nr:glycosyltransferase family 39 protein [Candidatus Obscuribacterales bacterium]